MADSSESNKTPQDEGEEGMDTSEPSAGATSPPASDHAMEEDTNVSDDGERPCVCVC